MAYNRIPTIDPFIMRLIPNDSNSTEKTEIQLFTLKQIKKKKKNTSPQAPEEKEFFFT